MLRRHNLFLLFQKTIVQKKTISLLHVLVNQSFSASYYVKRRITAYTQPVETPMLPNAFSIYFTAYEYQNIQVCLSIWCIVTIERAWVKKPGICLPIGCGYMSRWLWGNSSVTPNMERAQPIGALILKVDG